MERAATAVVTTRNRLHTLPLTIGSILGQVDVDMALVVVDEGSSDGTPAYLAGIDDPRVTVVRHDDPRGVSGARNAGIARAATRWVGICDDDDLWAPDKVVRQFEALEAEPHARWALTDSIQVDDDLRIIGYREMPAGGDVLAELLVANTTPATSGFFFDAELFAAVGGFEEGMNESEDWDLAIRLAEKSPVAVAHGPLVAYRLVAGGLSSNHARMEASFALIRDRYADLARAHGVEADAVGHERYLAQQAVKAGDARTGATAYARLALRTRAPADAARAALALVAPRAMDARGDARAAARVPGAWVVEASRWLACTHDFPSSAPDPTGG